MNKVQVNGLSVSWQAMIATLVFGLTLMASAWTLFQAQFSAADRLVSENKASAERMLSNLRRDMESDDASIKAEVLYLRNIIVTQRGDLVTQPEFKQLNQALHDRLDRLDKQLQALEVTRPTTGELQSTAKSLDAQVNRAEERLRALEEFIRGRSREQTR
jgi:hypothetical protein